MKTFFILSSIFFVCCDTFLPTNFGARETDYTHKSITETAVYHAAAEYIAKFIKPGVYNDTDLNVMKIIQDFFGQDNDSLNKFKAKIDYIVYGNNNAERQYRDNAIYTMNAEQIENGNLLLQNKRDTIIRMAKSPNPDWNFIRLTIGEYLMTLQMFYSNTNWVELKGPQVNTALGIRGETMLPVASPSMATCNDCNYTLHAILLGSCENNLIHNGGYLTSGYKSGQHNTKPIGQWVGNAGKCSHGGSWDDTRSLPARGGINKETSDPNLSPHFRLHGQAGEAAIKATVYFLVGAGTGLLHEIGAALFGDLLDLHATCYNCLDPKLSLTFVIDNTGSMGDDIAAVRKTTVDIVNQASHTGGVANYVLATFNDPVTKNTIRSTRDGNTVIDWLKNLKATGGDDCPEYAMHGLLDGIQHSLPGSCVFFFTDADPKDPELESEVTKALRDKSIHLMLFLRGQCNGEIQGDNSTQPSCVRRNDRENVGSRQRRGLGGNAWGLFNNIVSSTSSSAVKVSNTAISKTIGDIIDNSVGIHHTYIANLTMDSVSKSLKFPIDSYMKLFTIEVKGVSQSNIKLLHPDRTLETFSSNSTTIDNIGVAIVISVKKPIVGTWELQNAAGHTSEVLIKGNGNIDFTSQMMTKEHGVPYPLFGSSPIAGSNFTVGLTITDIADNDTVDKIIFRSKTDAIVKEIIVNNNNNHRVPRIISVDSEVPLKPFRITIEGTDKYGNQFRRTSKEMITPVTGNIDILPLSDDLIKGIPTNIYVNVTNAGSRQQTFIVVASDTENYLQLPKQNSIIIPPRSSTTVAFKLIGTKKMSVTTLTVELKKDSKTLQKTTRSIMVKDSVPPIFSTIKRSQNCSKVLMNDVNCSLGTWFTEVKVACSQPCVRFNVPSSSAKLTYGALNRTGDITANISGSCCSADCKLIAIDSISNIVQLPIDFTGGHQFEIIKSTNPVSSKKVDPPDVMIVGQSQNCTYIYMNSQNCTHSSWWATLKIEFQTEASDIYATPVKNEVGDGSSAKIEYDDLKSLKKIINANMSGTCCLYKVSLFAKDSLGQLSERKLDFSGGTQFQKIVSDDEYSKDSNGNGPASKSNVGAVIAGTVGGTVLVGTVTAISVHAYKKPSRIYNDKNTQHGKNRTDSTNETSQSDTYNEKKSSTDRK